MERRARYDSRLSRPSVRRWIASRETLLNVKSNAYYNEPNFKNYRNRDHCDRALSRRPLHRLLDPLRLRQPDTASQRAWWGRLPAAVLPRSEVRLVLDRRLSRAALEPRRYSGRKNQLEYREGGS